MNVYLPEFGLWQPPLLLAGRLWTPAEKKQESHLYIHGEQVISYILFYFNLFSTEKKCNAFWNDMRLRKIIFILAWTYPLRIKNTHLPNVIIWAPLGGEISSFCPGWLSFTCQQVPATLNPTNEPTLREYHVIAQFPHSPIHQVWKHVSQSCSVSVFILKPCSGSVFILP